MFVSVFLRDSSSASFPPSSLRAPDGGKSPGRSMPASLPLSPPTLSLTAPVGLAGKTELEFSCFLWSDSPKVVLHSQDLLREERSEHVRTLGNRPPDCYTRGVKARSRKFYLLLLLLRLYFLLESGFELLVLSPTTEVHVTLQPLAGGGTSQKTT